MINFYCTIGNPFAYDRKKSSKDYHVCKYYPVTQHKFIELEFGKFNPYNLIEFHLDLRWRGHDHAGPGFSFELYGWIFNVYMRDSRHWNYSKGTWQSEKQVEKP